MSKVGYGTFEQDNSKLSEDEKKRLMFGAIFRYPIFTFLIPIVFLLVLYSLFACLDREFCFENQPTDSR
jgi:hypothetical protein